MNGYKAPNSITPSSTRSSEVGLGTQASTACMAGQDAAELRAEAAALVSNRRLHALALERVGPVSVETHPCLQHLRTSVACRLPLASAHWHCVFASQLRLPDSRGNPRKSRRAYSASQLAPPLLFQDRRIQMRTVGSIPEIRGACCAGVTAVFFNAWASSYCRSFVTKQAAMVWCRGSVVKLSRCVSGSSGTPLRRHRCQPLHNTATLSR